MTKPSFNLYTKLIKPVIDFIASLVLILLLSPVLILAMLLLAVANNGSVWFIQQRPGKNGRPFYIIKFRTMNNATDQNGNLLSDADRLTNIGKIVRRTSVDEIPQLINVLKGDMSVVGPRPLLMEYLPLYDETQQKRHDVKPGITGWAQINGRNTVSWENKFEMDVWYVKNISFTLDIKILFLTVAKVFRSEGISSASSATMEKFNGKK